MFYLSLQDLSGLSNLHLDGRVYEAEAMTTAEGHPQTSIVLLASLPPHDSVVLPTHTWSHLAAATLLDPAVKVLPQ